MTQEDWREIGEQMTGQSPLAILTWAYEQFGSRVTLASSFGLEDVALIDMASRIVPEPDVFMLDTDLLFHETYATMRAVESRYRLKFRRIRPDLSLQAQAEQYGEELWARDPNLCCQLRKVIPLNRALAGYAAWITGIRREQSPTRAHARAVEWDQTHSLVKVNPLVLWSTEEVWQWVREHQVPYNPLHDQGFPSIGCMPCTRAIKPGEDLRAGRWSGFDKKECGLHL